MSEPYSPSPESDENHHETTDNRPPERSTSGVSPVVAMTFVIVLLLAALLVTWLGPWRAAGTSTSDELRKEAAKLEQLKAESARSGPIPTGGEQIADIASRIKKDADSVSALAERYQQLVDETHADLVRKNADLVASEENRKRERDGYYALRKDLDEAKDAARMADSLRREVSDLKASLDSRDREITRLKDELAKGSTASPAELADMQRRFDEALRAKDATIRALEDKLSQKNLFAKSDNELLPAAVELVQTLRKLENHPDIEISAAYSKIGAELGATMVKNLNFPTGSATMNPADDAPVRQLIDSVPEGDMVLVIGYASETGNVDDNRTLSSDRATGVAQVLTAAKKPGQAVQAFYMGQTDRFGSRVPERNQCCEIWHIRAKK